MRDRLEQLAVDIAGWTLAVLAIAGGLKLVHHRTPPRRARASITLNGRPLA
jgi:hypothetical protein